MSLARRPAAGGHKSAGHHGENGRSGGGTSNPSDGIEFGATSSPRSTSVLSTGGAGSGVPVSLDGAGSGIPSSPGDPSSGGRGSWPSGAGWASTGGPSSSARGRGSWPGGAGWARPDNPGSGGRDSSPGGATVTESSVLTAQQLSDLALASRWPMELAQEITSTPESKQEGNRAVGNAVSRASFSSPTPLRFEAAKAICVRAVRPPGIR